MNKVFFSSQNMCWCTPQDFYDELNKEFSFVLDPAATEKTAKCKNYFTPETDGLSQSWDFGGAVFCNPPYGREIGKWVEKAYKESLVIKYPIVLLIPARTDTTYFHNFIYWKAEIRFIKGRLRFTDEYGIPADAAPFPSLLAIYNGRNAKQIKEAYKTLKAIPIELKAANEFVASLHRHHAPVYRDKFRIGCEENGRLVGVIQLARPVSRELDNGKIIEAVRLCTDGTPNVCSFLYSRAARIAREMGYEKIITYILDTEDGTSLKACGWHKEADTSGGSWDTPSRPRETNAPTCKKQRWAMNLKGN